MKYTHTLGLDMDNYSMRGVLLSHKNSGQNINVIEKAVEIKGSFINDKEIINGIKEFTSTIGPQAHSAKISSVIRGKQVFVAKVLTPKVPDANLKKTLTYEIRKELPFEASSATLEFQKMSDKAREDDKVELMVAASTNTLIKRHIRLLEEGGLSPSIIEALPLTVANAFWESAKGAAIDAANIIIHIGAEVTTLVVDGEKVPFYTRQIYFTAGELYDEIDEGEEQKVVGSDRDTRLTALSKEIIRSLSYYEENLEDVSFATLNVLGQYNDPELLDALKAHTKLHVQINNITSELKTSEEMPPGKFDLAATLALSALE